MVVPSFDRATFGYTHERMAEQIQALQEQEKNSSLALTRIFKSRKTLEFSLVTTDC